MHSPSLLSALLLLVMTQATPGNWPQFRGPTGDGHAVADSLPTSWSEQQGVVWKTPVPGRGWSSPVIGHNRIWLTTATPDGTELSVLCVDARSGEIQLLKQIFSVAQPQDIHLTNSHASPTPVIEGERIYVHFGAYGTACLDTQDARVVWQRRDFPCNHWRGAGSSPILFEELLILHFDGYDYQYLVALDKRTGETRWKIDREIDYQTDDGDLKKAFCTPTIIDVHGQRQLISPAAKAAIAYNPDNGHEIWRIHYPNHSATARPLYGHGLVFINSGFGRAQLYAVRPDGHGDVTDTRIVWTADKSIGSKPSHLLVDGRLYVLHDRGTASCLDALTGQILWTSRVGGNFSASPIFGAGKIYFVNEEGETTVIQPGQDYVELARNELDDGCMASPAVFEDSLILRTTTHLYRIGSQE